MKHFCKQLFIFLFAFLPSLAFSQINTDTLNVEYKMLSLEELLNVKLVTAGKKEQKIAEIPASTVVINKSDIERHGYKSLSEVLESVPGLYGIDQRDDAGMIFGVRGYWSSSARNIIILINGVRQERIESDGAVYAAQYIPVESIDRIEVIRGPMSVVYGPGAFFGTINIITNDAKESSQVAVSAGLENTHKATTRVAYQKDDLSMVVNAGYYNTDGPDLAHDKMSSMDLSGITPFTSSDGLLGENNKFFNFSGSYKGFYGNFTHNHSDKQFYLLFLPSAEDGCHADITYTSASIGYKHEFSSKFSLDGKLTYHKGSTLGDFGMFVPANTLNIGGDFNNKEDFEYDFTAYYAPSEKFNITTGLYYKKILGEQLEGVYPLFNLMYRVGLKDPIENQAVFTQADYAPTDWMRFVVGLRFEQAKKYGVYNRDLTNGISGGGDAEFGHDDIEFIPRLAAIFNLNEHNILKFLYGKAINNPSFYQTASQVNPGQPALKPEFITTYELNYFSILSSKININTSVFYNAFDDQIIVNPIFVPAEGTYISNMSNEGEMKTFGFEMSLLAKPSERFSIELSGTWQKTDDEREGYEDIDVAYSPEILGQMKVAYDFTPDITFSVNCKYVGEMETLWDATNNQRIANKTDGYFLAGVNFRYNNIAGTKFYAGLSASNIFDTEYYFPTFTLNATWADKGLLGYGRMVMLNLGYKF